MSVVEYKKRGRSKATWGDRDKRATRHQIPGSLTPSVIDYKKLEELCRIQGLADSSNPQTSEEAHLQFMQHYPSIFVQDEPRTGLPTHSLTRSQMKASQTSIATTTGGFSKSVVAAETSLEHKHAVAKKQPDPGTQDASHDVRDWLPQLHKQRRSEDPRALRADRIKHLRRLCKKLPFERSAAETEQIYRNLKHFEQISCQVSPSVLRELGVVAQLEAWKETDMTMFGNTGFHMVLRGSVKPRSAPFCILQGESPHIRMPTPEPDTEMPMLGVGECFGTLEKVEGRDANSRILTVVTLEPNTEFLKISTSDFQRVKGQIHQRNQTEKINLMQSCKTYQLWSKQPLQNVAELLEWQEFPANTVLVSEGYRAPFVAIIKTGECHVLRYVDVLNTLPGGKQEKKTKQVVMGNLGPCDSFGEISVIDQESMTCSIVTASPVHLAQIEPNKLGDLDEVTLQLLVQSSVRTYGDVTRDDIHEEYISQELKREWNEFKHNAVVNVINSRGIRPGYGKWSK